jgi:hypothetical protein
MGKAMEASWENNQALYMALKELEEKEALRPSAAAIQNLTQEQKRIIELIAADNRPDDWVVTPEYIQDLITKDNARIELDAGAADIKRGKFYDNELHNALAEMVELLEQSFMDLPPEVRDKHNNSYLHWFEWLSGRYESRIVRLEAENARLRKQIYS